MYQLDGEAKALLKTKESIISLCVAADSRHLLVRTVSSCGHQAAHEVVPTRL